MAQVRLTDRFVAGVKFDAVQRDYFDDQTTGLFLRVSGRRKSWGLFYTRAADGKRARATFGTYPATSLAAARARAIELRSGLEEGRDAAAAVRATKKGDPAAPTVVRLVEEFIADRRRRGRRSADKVERSMKADVIPTIGDIALSELERRHLVQVTDSVLDRGASGQARRLQASMKAMTAWGLDSGMLKADPGHRWKPVSEAGEIRDRVLSDDEIGRWWRALEAADMSRWTIEALRFCLVTGARQGEVAGMLRDELDLENRLWRMPAARSKNKRAHDIPLSDLAISILTPVLGAHKVPAVFPGPRGTPLTNSAVSRAVQRSQTSVGLAKWTAHDLRRTAATSMAILGVSPFDIGLVLNHVSTTRSTVTTSVYVKHSFEKEKRAALDLWSERLSAIIGGNAASITSMNPSRKRYGVRAAKGRAAWVG